MEEASSRPPAGLPEAGAVRLAVGLGNPGDKYAGTRHNAGAELLARLIAREGLEQPAPLRDLPLAVAGTAAGVRYALPSTYMNDSGAAVGPGCRYLDVEARSLLVIHDEVDLPPGKAKLKFGGGHAGHNGLRDIDAQLGTSNYWRLRLGVGKPDDPRFELRDYVLARTDAEEAELIAEAGDRVLDAWDLVKAGEMDEAMRRINRRTP
ncbi:MAG: aminoacyl-tRNA hydrolase [Betaproteobacteria bacterium AqS2]|uniref:Peptidyl-tRNA hydrolase n=1 Tax=Candidatus Amphirhobacter heronislandensis TaxID=1732024 RepID=A0A930UHM0_9GAMM|nr:aminoacyl-tRNA hydrolase [Betaproteobacteria bacterium AqS2]